MPPDTDTLYIIHLDLAAILLGNRSHLTMYSIRVSVQSIYSMLYNICVLTKLPMIKARSHRALTIATALILQRALIFTRPVTAKVMAAHRVKVKVILHAVILVAPGEQEFTLRERPQISPE